MNPPTLCQTRSKGSNNLVLLPMLPSSKQSKKSDSSPSTLVKNGIINHIRDTKDKDLEDASKRLNCRIDQKQLARSAKFPRRSLRITQAKNKKNNPYKNRKPAYPSSHSESSLSVAKDDDSASTTVSQPQKQIDDAADAARKMIALPAGGGGGDGYHLATIQVTDCINNTTTLIPISTPFPLNSVTAISAMNIHLNQVQGNTDNNLTAVVFLESKKQPVVSSDSQKPVGFQDSQQAVPESSMPNSSTDLTVQETSQPKVSTFFPNVKDNTNQESKKSIQDSQLPSKTIQESQVASSTLESQQPGPGNHDLVSLPSQKCRKDLADSRNIRRQQQQSDNQEKEDSTTLDSQQGVPTLDSQNPSLESQEPKSKKRCVPSRSSASNKVDYKDHSDGEGTVYSSEDDQFCLTKKAGSNPDDVDDVVVAADANDEELEEAVAVDDDEQEVVAPVQLPGLPHS